ncbi:hypothetical protein JCM13304A_11880 [Desulfothermus okinawensis JCM 13304]
MKKLGLISTVFFLIFFVPLDLFATGKITIVYTANTFGTIDPCPV